MARISLRSTSDSDRYFVYSLYTCFHSFYHLSQNTNTIIHLSKRFQLLVIAAFERADSYQFLGQSFEERFPRVLSPESTNARRIVTALAWRLTTRSFNAKDFRYSQGLAFRCLHCSIGLVSAVRGKLDLLGPYKTCLIFKSTP